MKNYFKIMLFSLILYLGTHQTQAQTNTFPVNGNVGVGTSTPDYNLQLHSPSFSIMGITGASPGILFSQSSSYNLSVAAIGLATTNFGNYHATANIGDFNIRSGEGKDIILGTLSWGATNGTERMRIANGGNIGIGTTNPTAKLHLNGSFRLANGTQQAGRVLTSDANGNATWQAINAANDNDWVVNGNDQYSDVSGNVGIGTNNPQQKLHIHNPDPTKETFTLLSGTAPGMLFSATPTYDLTVPAIGLTTTANLHYHSTSNEGDLNIRGGAGKDLIFGTLGLGATNGTERMRITNAGQVKIGAEGTLTDLDVKGKVIATKDIRNNRVKLGGVAGYIKLRHIDDATNFKAAIAPSDLATSELLLNYNSEFTNGTRVMGTGLLVNGKIAIGDGTNEAGFHNDYQLAVRGNILAEELKIRTYANWPDYVFRENYKLPTLQQLEAHIKTRGHLPGIPSAAEVAENGVAVGEMQAKLLEKIEELSLHLIEMNKRIDELERENQSLKNRK